MVLYQGQRNQMTTKRVPRYLLVTGMLKVLKYFIIKQEPEAFDFHQFSSFPEVFFEVLNCFVWPAVFTYEINKREFS